jgi:hypothetical protein
MRIEAIQLSIIIDVYSIYSDYLNSPTNWTHQPTGQEKHHGHLYFIILNLLLDLSQLIIYLMSVY